MEYRGKSELITVLCTTAQFENTASNAISAVQLFLTQSSLSLQQQASKWMCRHLPILRVAEHHSLSTQQASFTLNTYTKNCPGFSISFLGGSRTGFLVFVCTPL